MPGDFGAFMTGLTQSMNAGQEMKTKRQQMELQKKLLDSQIKAADIEAQLKKSKADMILKGLGLGDAGGMNIGGGTPLTAPSTYDLPLPGLIAKQTASPAPVQTSPQVGQASGTPSWGITPDLAFRAAVKELFDIDPKESQKWQQVDYYNPETKQYGKIDKDLNTGQTRPGSFTAIPKIITEKVTVGGKEYYRDIDENTRQPVGIRSASEGPKALGTTEANTIALTKNSLRDAQTAIDALFSEGQPGLPKMVSSFLNLPGTKGREFSQSWDRATKPLMVALTGTGMSNQEAEKIINMSKPLPGDSDKSKQQKIESLVDFMQERLKLMDPSGEYGLVNIKLPWQKKAGGGKASASKTISPEEEAAAYMKGK